MKPSRAALFVVLSLTACTHAAGGQGLPASDAAKAELKAAQQKALSGDAAAAQGDYARLQQAYPETDVAAEALFGEAELAYAQKDYPRARDRYRSLLAQFPLFPRGDEAKYHLGLCSLALGDPRDALQTLAPLYGRLPPAEKPQAAAALGRAAMAAHAWTDAVRYLADAETAAPDAQSRAQQGEALFALIDSQVPMLDIAKLAQELPPSSPAYPLVQFKLARIAYHLHDWNQLKSTLETLQKNAPSHPFAAEAQKLLDRVGRRDQVKPDVVGVILPLSGTYQLFGEQALAGIKLALAGSKAELVVKDSVGDPETAKREVDELVLDDQAIALIGPILSNEAQAAAVEADDLGVPIVTLSREEGITGLGPYVFRNMLTNSAQAKALVDYAARVRGFKTFGLLYPNIPYGVELANDFWDGVLDAGGEVNAAETYDHDQTTFAPMAKKLVGRYFLEDRLDYMEKRRELVQRVKDPYRQKKALEKLRSGLPPAVDFQALFIPDGQKNVGLIAPALAVEDIITDGCDENDMKRIAKTLDVPDPKKVKTVLLLGANAWDSPDLVQRGGKFVECSVFVDGFYAGSDRPATQRFVKAFQAANGGRAPDLLAAYGYDSGKMVRHVLTKDQPSSRDGFREAFARIRSFSGATGSITVNAHNEAERPLFFLTIDKLGIHELDTSAKVGG